MRSTRRKFTVFLILLAAGIGLAGFWSWKSNIYSKEVIKLEILGSEEATLAQEIEYIVKYKNNGNTRLEEPELIFEYPKYSLPVGEESQIVRKGAAELGDSIYPGEEKTLRFKARLLGKEGEAKIAKAALSYQPKNLKARYESSTTFTTVIKEAPITFEFDLPSKVESGEDFRFNINYFSNTDYLFTGLRIQVEYPFGFEFIESYPKSIEKIEWEIAVLNKSQGGRIEVAGRLSGEVGEAKIFKAKLGIWQDGEFILLKEATKGLEIIKPLIYLTQEINDNPRYVALPGDWLHYEIYFKNIGDEDLNNLFMINKLEGEAFDFQTLKSELGDYQSGDDSVIFDWRRVSKLQYLAPTEEGKVDFWVKLKDDLGNVKNPVLRNKIFISQVREEFVTKISSKIEITQKGYFQDEVFGNSGPLPPEPWQATTYTIIWQVKNYYSDVKEAKVKATLPEGVELTGKIFPEEEAQKFSFDSQSREIVWSLGDLERGIGLLKPSKSLAFQISFTPDESQRNQNPEIIGQVKITAEDSWTEMNLENSSPAINTTLPDDPTIDTEQGVVR